MGSLRSLSSEGTKEHGADELDRIDLAYGVPPEGLKLVVLDKDDDTALVTFQARRSNFLEKIRQAWRDYASHPRFSGKPATLAIQVLRNHNHEEWTINLCINHDHGALAGKEITQETANTLWQTVVKLWAEYMERHEP